MGPVPRELIPRLLHVLVPLLQKACEYSGGRFTPETVLEKCMSGEFTLWAVIRDRQTFLALSVTSVSEYPTGLRVLEVLLVSGEDRKSWLHFESRLREQAIKWKCQRMQMVGRKGWAKTLPEDWRHVAVMFEIDLEA